jgi:sugar-specific transcriptional regulator TrmB
MTNSYGLTPEASLAALGFTELEATIYCELQRRAASTGYRLAQAIGKAPANVYQALATLTQKGAIMVDDGDTKTYRAIGPAELLSGLRRTFEKSRVLAESALAELGTNAEDDRIYQLKGPAQVYERAATLIASAKEVLLFDLFPGPLTVLGPLLLKAHARGVKVAGIVYQPSQDWPFVAEMADSSEFVMERWPGSQLTLIADAREYLVALLAGDDQQAKHAVWSDSVYLACLQHSGLAAEIRIAAARHDQGDPRSAISLLRSYPPGLRTLIGPSQVLEKEQ